MTVATKATPELRAGDVVLVWATEHPRRVLRATPSDSYSVRSATIQRVSPDPYTKWEYRKPATSARWSLYFTDGTYAGSTISAQWMVVEAASDDPYCAAHAARFDERVGCSGCV